jgi:hypothetical protein
MAIWPGDHQGIVKNQLRDAEIHIVIAFVGPILLLRPHPFHDLPRILLCSYVFVATKRESQGFRVLSFERQLSRNRGGAKIKP